MANTTKTVGIVLLVIGAVLSIGTGFIMIINPYVIGNLGQWLYFILAIVIGVVLFCIGLGLFVRSREINGRDK